MNLHSSAFEDGGPIDKEHTSDGQDVSPPLDWTDVPEGTKSLALICDDPDAPSPKRPGPEPWVHWVLYSIPASATEIPAGVGPHREPAELPGARQGVNSWSSDNIGYRGPAPPPGSGPHRYVFTLFAIDTELKLKPGASKKQLLDAISGHVIAEAQWMGTYER